MRKKWTIGLNSYISIHDRKHTVFTGCLASIGYLLIVRLAPDSVGGRRLRRIL